MEYRWKIEQPISLQQHTWALLGLPAVEHLIPESRAPNTAASKAVEYAGTGDDLRQGEGIVARKRPW
jgi:hypothetical protein